MIRILIVEDDVKREEVLLSWLPESVRPVVASSAGQAIGILRRDSGSIYAGIILDHDLQGRIASEADQFLSGQEVAHAIIETISRRAPILVHSVNQSQGAVLARQLQAAGFEVTKIPMNILNRETFQEWLTKVVSIATDMK